MVSVPGASPRVTKIMPRGRLLGGGGGGGGGGVWGCRGVWGWVGGKDLPLWGSHFSPVAILEAKRQMFASA
ncbi:MAG: hypothetical protein IPI60_15705 [Saprospiraceae bacterium]|nr:hypothetical protein [Saprospiraceae bacterium]